MKVRQMNKEMTITEIDEIKSDMCDNYCKYLDKANKMHLTSLKDLDELTNMMHDICANCSLNKL